MTAVEKPVTVYQQFTLDDGDTDEEEGEANVIAGAAAPMGVQHTPNGAPAAQVAEKPAGKEAGLPGQSGWEARARINYAEVLTDFYSKHNPEKLGRIPMILQRFADREDQLIQELHRKYPESQAQMPRVAINPGSFSSSSSSVPLTKLDHPKKIQDLYQARNPARRP